MNTQGLSIVSGHPPCRCDSESAASSSADSSFKSPRRIQDSFTASPERKILLWLAARMPARINSDHLTLLGFVAMSLVGASYALARWSSLGLLLASVFLAFNWLGDSLDGTLARFRNCQRPRYGFYVDHVIDSLGAIFLISGLSFSRYIDWRIAAATLVAFLLLSIETYLATYTLGSFRMSFGKFGPTEIRLLLGIGNIVLWLRPSARAAVHSLSLLDFGGIIATCGMALMFLVVAIAHARTLYRQETRR